MSKEYDNTNSGVLFKNEDRKTDKHPDYRGSINLDGVDCWLSAWLKTSKGGKKYMSLSVSPKEANRTPRAEYGETQAADFDDDIPF